MASSWEATGARKDRREALQTPKGGDGGERLEKNFGADVVVSVMRQLVKNIYVGDWTSWLDL